MLQYMFQILLHIKKSSELKIRSGQDYIIMPLSMKGESAVSTYWVKTTMWACLVEQYNSKHTVCKKSSIFDYTWWVQL